MFHVQIQDILDGSQNFKVHSRDSDLVLGVRGQGSGVRGHWVRVIYWWSFPFDRNTF